MKAYIGENNTARLTGAGPYHGYPIRLTIGMIVKNEEKTLDRCLSSLKPLMEAVESELIITDTGSTDRTVEIAKKYTDHILHFEWCDDFSAARNTGLNAARGEWFMFLDGDEWFENTDGLTRFFTSGECDRYVSVSYIQRNYSDDSKQTYSDFPALRITRMYPGIHFKHIIHEDFGRRTPIKYLDDYVNHCGYIYHNEDEKKKKMDRNGKLLEKEIAEDPSDLKAYYQLSKQYFMTEDFHAVEEYGLRGLQAEKQCPHRIWRTALQHNLVGAYYGMKQYDRVLNLVEGLEQEGPKREIIWLDFYGYAQSAAYSIRDYKRSVACGQAYRALYEQTRDRSKDDAFKTLTYYTFQTPRRREELMRLLAKTYLLLKQPEQALESLDYLEPSDPREITSFFQTAVQICAQADDWTKLPDCYRRACSFFGEERRIEVARILETNLPPEETSKPGASKVLAEIQEEDNPFVRLCRLRKAEADNHSDALKELDWFFRWNGNWEPLFSDALFFAMKEKVNIMPLILKIDSEELKYYAVNLQTRHPDLPDVVRDYSEAYSFENIRGLYWSVCLRERVLLSDDSPFKNEEEEIRFFHEYAGQVAKYVRALYRPELLVSDRVSILPRAHRFGYYMGLALSAQNCSDGETYLSNLRLALESYPVMKRPVTLLLKRFEQEEEQRREKGKEFHELAGQVKEQIQMLIAQDRLKEAGQVTVRLAALMPGDPDIARFRILTHTEPDMNELAAQLPQ